MTVLNRREKKFFRSGRCRSRFCPHANFVSPGQNLLAVLSSTDGIQILSLFRRNCSPPPFDADDAPPFQILIYSTPLHPFKWHVMLSVCVQLSRVWYILRWVSEGPKASFAAHIEKSSIHRWSSCDLLSN